MRRLFFLLPLLAITSATAQAGSPCHFPDDGNDLSAPTACPLFDWQPRNGTLHIPDRGEYLYVTDAGTLFVERTPQALPEPYRSLYQALRLGQPTRPPERDPSTPIFYETSPNTAAVIGKRLAQANSLLHWQQELYVATRALLEAYLRPNTTVSRAVVYGYAPGQVLTLNAEAERLTQALARVQRARHVLLNQGL